MSKCYICGDEIVTDNESEEHIVLNAIGGTLKSKNLICKKCNSVFGENIDAELANQLNFVSNMLDIQRDRKPVPNLRATLSKTGEPMLVQPGGKPARIKPEISEEIGEEDKKVINIKAPDYKSMRKTLNGLKRKHNLNIDIDKAMENAEKGKEYLDEELKISIKLGGDKAFRAVCKMAVNFYMLKGGERTVIEHLIPFIKGEDNIKCVSYYYDDVNIISKDEDEILHSIIIKGDVNEGILYAYIELFNFYKFVILLNDNYEGESIYFDYYFNVLQRIEISKTNNFNICKEKIISLIKDYKDQKEEIAKELNKIVGIALKNQNDSIRNELLTEAIEEWGAKYQEGTTFTEEMINDFVDTVMKKITPWLLHNIK